VLVGAVLRFATLDDQSFWLDEAYTVRLLDQPLGDMLRDLPDQESAPPLYYLLAWGWGHVFGFGEVGLRSLSALVGTLLIPVAYAAGTRLAGRRAGVVAAGLVAVHPLLVWFSQEARAYALVALLAALSLVGFLAVLERPDGRAWAAWAVPAALALATHYYAGFLVLAEAAWLIWRCPRDRRMALAAGGVALTALALLPLALAQRSTGNTAYIGEGSVSTRLVQVPKQLLTGYASPGQALTTALVAVLVAVAAARLATVRDRAGRGRVLVVAGLGLAAVLIPVVLVVPGLDYLNTRNVLSALPVLLVALAGGLALPGARLAGWPLAATACGLLLAVTLLVTGRDEYGRDDWRGVDAALGSGPATRALVVSPGSGWIPLGLYDAGLKPMPAQGAPVSEVAVVGVARRRSGGRRDPAPVPATPPGLPPGFRAAGVRRSDTYTVARYAAARPEVVRPADLAAGALWPGDAAVLVDTR
jgi:hypothetical protein